MSRDTARESSPSPTSETPRTRKWGVVICLAALAIAPYLLALNTPFVFDDTGDIATNEAVHQLWPPTWLDSGRPVVTLTFALCWLAGGGSTVPFHLFNVALHAANTVLLWAVLRHALRLPRVPFSMREHADDIALWASALWSVHPLHTSAVTYVVHRYESLAAFFYLLTVLVFVRGCQLSSSRIKWAGLACVTAGLAALSKEIAITLPVAVLLLDHVLVASTPRELVRRRGLVHAVIAATVVLVLLAVVGPRDANSSQGMHLTQLRPLDYARTELGVIARYMRQIVWPTGLAIDYFDWPVARRFTDVLPGALLTIGALAATAVLVIRRNPLGVALAWFFVILAPTSSVLPLAGEMVAERRLYLPLMAPALLASLLLQALRTVRPRWATAAVVAVVAALALATGHRNRDYRSAAAVLGDTVAKRPQNPRVRYNYGNALKDEGRIDLALEQYRASMALDPGYMEPHRNAVSAANLLGRRNPWEDGASFTPEQAQQEDATADALVARADRSFAAGRREEAVSLLLEASRLAPRSDAAHARLAIALALAPEPRNRRAAVALEAGLRAWGLRGGVFEPQLAEAVASAFAELGRFDDAIRVTRQLRDYLAAAGLTDAAARQDALADAYSRHERWSLTPR